MKLFFRRAFSSQTASWSQILRISPNATMSEIQQAFKNLAKTHHPDQFMSAPAAEIKKKTQEFQEILEAYKTALKCKSKEVPHGADDGSMEAVRRAEQALREASARVEACREAEQALIASRRAEEQRHEQLLRKSEAKAQAQREWLERTRAENTRAAEARQRTEQARRAAEEKQPTEQMLKEREKSLRKNGAVGFTGLMFGLSMFSLLKNNARENILEDIATNTNTERNVYVEKQIKEHSNTRVVSLIGTVLVGAALAAVRMRAGS